MSAPANFDSDVYNDDVNSDDQMDNPDNYDVAIDEDRPEDDEPLMDKKELDRKFNDLLFCVQGVGSYKDINGFQMYVKHKDCLESLKDIYKHLKADSSNYPFIRLTLGRWNFFEKDLVPLFMFHKQDKKLSFLATMVMINLTAMPSEGCLKSATLLE